MVWELSQSLLNNTKNERQFIIINFLHHGQHVVGIGIGVGIPSSKII